VYAGLALIVAIALVTGCSKGGGADLTDATSSGAKVDLDVLAQVNEDCLQYLVTTREDGIQVWHSDYPNFYLIDTKTGKLVKDEKGQPMAYGVLFRQAREIMARHPELESTTTWGVRLTRYEQLSKDGKELSRSEPKIIDKDFDLGELIKKDRETRTQLGG
jgi:hypothetical protein